MIVSLSSLALGVIVGYLGQRSRMCSIGGLRDYVLVRDTGLLRGAAALLVTAWVAFAVVPAVREMRGGSGAGQCPGDDAIGIDDDLQPPSAVRRPFRRKSGGL